MSDITQISPVMVLTGVLNSYLAYVDSLSVIFSNATSLAISSTAFRDPSVCL